MANTPRKSRQHRTRRLFEAVMPAADEVRIFVDRARTKITLEQRPTGARRGSQAAAVCRLNLRPEQVEHVCSMLQTACEHAQ